MAGSEAGSSEHELEDLEKGFYHPHPPSPRHTLHQRKVQNGKRSDSYKPEVNYVRSNAKVDKETMYSVTFREHGKDELARCRASPIKHKECIENFGSAKTESTSVMKNDFRHHDKPERATLHRPQPETQVEGGAFETDSSYKKDYSKKPIKTVAAIKPQEYQAPTARFEGSSTVKSDYTPHPGHRREPPFRPPMNQQPDKTKFATSTTTGQTYCEWPAKRMEKPTWAKQKAYEPTPNENAYSSSYQSDFIQPVGYKRAQLVKPVRQDENLLHGPRKESHIPKQTHYKEQFVPSSGRAAKSFKQNQVYEAPTEKFKAESVYQSNYTGDRVPPALAIVPQQRRNSDEAPHSIDFHTTYNDTFKNDRPSSCPAKELLTASDEFGHIGFKNGHQFYVQKSPRRCKTAKNIDPLFPATPESQKTDRERSSSRPPSASNTPRSPTKADRPTSGRVSRPTTPRAKPTSANKDSKTQTSPRKDVGAKRPTTPSNRNNSNSNASSRPASAKTSSPRKAPSTSSPRKAPAASSPRKAPATSSPRKDTKTPTNRNNSNSHTAQKAEPKEVGSPKAGPKAATSPDKKAAIPKVDSKNGNSNNKAPPPIRRPNKQEDPAPSKVPNLSTNQPVISSKEASTAVKAASEVPVTTTTATPAAPTTTKPITAPSAPAPTAPSAVPVTPTATNDAPAPVSQQPIKPQPVDLPVSKSVEKSVVRPIVPSTPPMSTSAPAAPVINSAPLVSDQTLAKASPVEPVPIKPMTAVTAAAAPPAPTSILPPTLVAAPPAPVMPPMPPQQQQQQPPAPPMDLSMFDSPKHTPAPPPVQPTLDPVDLSPKMPVIAPPPAPAQPVVRMGNGPREANLID